jgi:hypothetical protein
LFVTGTCHNTVSCITTKNLAACCLVSQLYGSNLSGVENCVSPFVYIHPIALLNSSSELGSFHAGSALEDVIVDTGVVVTVVVGAVAAVNTGAFGASTTGVFGGVVLLFKIRSSNSSTDGSAASGLIFIVAVNNTTKIHNTIFFMREHII